MNQTLLIGDIHACYTEFLRLLEAAGLSGEDRIIALGDMVDRGPAVQAVLDFFQTRPYAAALRGNHERKHIRWSQKQVRPALSQRITREQLGPEYFPAVAFLETLPAYLELPEAVLVHGYLEPGVPFAEQQETVLCGTMAGEAHLARSYDRPWYELVELDKPVVFGHKDFHKNGQPFVYRDRFFGLDTSCVLGKSLTGLLLPDFRLISVPAEKNYWFETRQMFRHLAQPKKGKPKPIARLPWEEADESVLAQVLAHIRGEHARVTARLEADPMLVTMTIRQQAKRYAELVSGSPVGPLLHLERRGELSLESARRILRNPEQARKILDELS